MIFTVQKIVVIFDLWIYHGMTRPRIFFISATFGLLSIFPQGLLLYLIISHLYVKFIILQLALLMFY